MLVSVVLVHLNFFRLFLDQVSFIVVIQGLLSSLYTYFQVLDKIVERDFYPELTRLKLTTAYVEALDSNDVERLRQIQLQLERATPSVNNLLSMFYM